MSRLTWLLTFLFVVGLPFGAKFFSSADVSYLFSFPPDFGHVDHLPFRSQLTALVLSCLAVLPILWLLFRRKDRIYRHNLVLERRHFPKWGYLGYALLGISWVIAWTRLPSFSGIQIYTFTPLWLGFIVVVNAHVHQRSNTAPLYKSPSKFAGLFLLSALFWWGFEFLNRFTENWIYTGVEGLSASHYYIHGSICFSTVLPAVYSVFRWLHSHNPLHRTFYIGPRLGLLRSRGVGLVFLVVGLVGMAGVGLWPQFSYPFLWLGPVCIYGGLQLLFGKTSGISSWARGDWRWVALWGLSGLICGFFWELWNFYSQLKWEYQVSFFNGWPIFEMPLLGYLGYLPFGIFCGLVTQLIFQKRAGIEFSPNE